MEGLGSAPGVLSSLQSREQSWTVLAPTTNLKVLLHVGGGGSLQSEATLSTGFPGRSLLKLPMAYRKVASQNSR